MINCFKLEGKMADMAKKKSMLGVEKHMQPQRVLLAEKTHAVWVTVSLKLIHLDFPSTQTQT